MAAATTTPARILRHKFQYRAPDSKTVIRSDLLARVERNADVNCVIVQAPAGHGKTTLLRQLAGHFRDQGELTTWLTLDEADNDLSRLISHLDQVIGTLEDGEQSPAVSMEEDDASLPKGLADRVCNRLLDLGKPVHLFFDDFQAIEQANVEKTFQDIVARLAQNITVYIASRSVPRIGVPELLVKQRALLFRYDDLKFTLSEAREFFGKEQSLSLSEDEVATIYSRSEGWPAALQLFRLALSSNPARDALNNLESYTPFQISEYLASNVLQAQTARTQEFLLKCSVLRTLCAPLCDAITGWEDSRDFLLALERSGVFLNNIDNEMEWFEFHGLFANYLQDLLHKEYPGMPKDIHRRAAHWFFDNELYESSLYHAIEAGEFSLAAHAMDIWATEQITHACLLSVERWADRLPLQTIAERPALAVKIAWALTFLRRYKKVRPYLELLKSINDDDVDAQFQVERRIITAVVEHALDNLDVAMDIVESIETGDHHATDFWAFELGATSNMKAFRAIATGNFPAARLHIAEGRIHSHEGKAPFLARYNTGLSIISNYIQGRVQEAAERSHAAIKSTAFDIAESHAAAGAICCALLPLYELNQADTALEVFRQYRKDIDTSLMLDFVVVAYLPMIRLHDARQEHAAAEALLDSLEEIGLTAGWERMIALCRWEMVRRHIMRGDIAGANAMAEGLEQTTANSPNAHLTFAEVIEDPELCRLRLLAHSGGDDTLRSQLQQAIDRARSHNRVPREIKLRLISAIDHHHRGGPEAALKVLKTALMLASEYGFIRTVLDEGPAVVSLLQTASREAWPFSLSSYIGSLLSHTEEHQLQSVSTAGQLPTDELTNREMQMLVLLAKGEPNKTIARQLFVSENTVKFHLKNIYVKLGAKTRTQAITTAISLGII